MDMTIPTIPDQMFILILVIILALVIIIIVFQWRKVAQAKTSVAMLDKEIRLCN